jgi:hypothetical protein
MAALIQQRIGIALGINRMLDSSKPTILIAHALHFIHQPSNFVIYALSYLFARSSLLAVNSAKLVVQALGHFSELTPGPSQGEAIPGSKGAEFFSRHR